MAKPPFNVGVVSGTEGKKPFDRPLPGNDPNPETNPAAAKLVDEAAVKTDMAQQSIAKVEEVKVKVKPVTPQPLSERHLPKFSLATEHVEALEETMKRFRVASGGEDVHMSRVVAAGLLALAKLPDADMVEAIRLVPMRKAGRKAR